QKRGQNDGVESLVGVGPLPLPSRGAGQHRGGRRGAGRLERPAQAAGADFRGNGGGDGRILPGCAGRRLGGAGGAAGPLSPGSGFFGAGAAAGDGEAGGHFLREGDRSGIGGFQTARRPPGPGGWSLRPEGGGASDPFRRSDSGGRGRRGQDPGRGGEADRGMGADLQPSGLRRSAAGKGGRKGFARGAPDGGRRGRNRALSPSVPP